jgi:histidinol-phosphate aminotransferase
VTGVEVRPLAAGFSPYVWSATTAEVAARHGIDAAIVLRFDANVPPLPGVPQVPLGKSFERLNEYPDGGYVELRSAAAAYAGVEPDQIVIGAGADDLIGLAARTFLWHGRTASVSAPTYPVYAIASAIEGAEVVDHGSDADVVWICNPNNPTGELLAPEEIVARARARPQSAVIVDEAYFEYSGVSVVPLLPQAPNVVVIRTLSKAFGLAALRVGYAIASHDVAEQMDARRAPAPISAPAARVAAAALREPRFDIESVVTERRRMRDALVQAGYDCPEMYANFVLLKLPDPEDVANDLERRGLVVRLVPGGVRITVRLPAENDRILAALGAAAPPTRTRSALVVRTTTETAVRVSVDLDGQSRTRINTGIGMFDHLVTQLCFHAGFDADVGAGGDLDVDAHHTVEDVLAALGAAVSKALGSREGVARFGSATVPMDESSATAAVDVIRRPHAEIALAAADDRIGKLRLALLRHALERLAMEAAMTVHVDARGSDAHHTAEAAFKALGRALRLACAPERGGSTKGTL